MKEERFYEEEFTAFIKQLVDSGWLDAKDAFTGICRQIVGKGYNSLPEDQKRVFCHNINKFIVEKCKALDQDIPWNEMFEALQNGGYSEDGLAFVAECDKE